LADRLANRSSRRRRSRERDQSPPYACERVGRRAVQETKICAERGNFMSTPLTRAGLGFVAAALSVLIAHESIVQILNILGRVQRQGWTLTPPVAPFGVPYLVNLIFWGGLWGILFAYIHPLLPGRMMWLKGLIYGLIIVVLGGWIAVPLIKGQMFGIPNQPLFAGFDVQRMLNSALIVGGYGLGLGIIYGLIARERA
jgi:hypothetical protein